LSEPKELLTNTSSDSLLFIIHDGCSGGTPQHPDLLKYTCDLLTNVRPVPPAVVILPPDLTTSSSKQGLGKRDSACGSSSTELISSVLEGMPVLALTFEEMVVRSKNKLRNFHN
jgi:hypothetical protein